MIKERALIQRYHGLALRDRHEVDTNFPVSRSCEEAEMNFQHWIKLRDRHIAKLSDLLRSQDDERTNEN